MVRGYLHLDTQDMSLEELLEKFVEAEWLEKRIVDLIAIGVNKGVMGNEK